MIPAYQLKPASEYIAVIRPLLPREAFRPDPRHLLRIAGHLAIITAGYVVLRQTNALWLAILASLVLGHSQACLVFLGHDLSHNAIVKDARIRRPLELLIWGLNLIPPSLWFRVHNQNHHPETNTLKDTDRVYRACEETRANRLYNRLFHPNRKTPLRHPIVLVHFVTYIIRHLVAALMPEDRKPSVVTFKPSYSPALKRQILTELAIIAAFQVALWFFFRGSWWRYVLAVPVPIILASCVAMTYLFTNHFLNPLCEKADPLIGATSVEVPRFFDWLHDNNSYHTEHHLFPGMNPRYYPLVSGLLRQHFPNRYNRMPIGEAWRRIWAQDEFIAEPDNLPGLQSPAMRMAAE
jgi:fatty acid desaturase